MTTTTSLLELLQDAVADRLAVLRTERGLAGLAIVTEHKGDLDSELQERIQAADLGLLVMTPSWQRGETVDHLVVEVGVALTLNVKQAVSSTGCRRTANEIGELIYASLHRWQPADQGWTRLEFQSWAPRDIEARANVVIYTAQFRTTTLISIQE